MTIRLPSVSEVGPDRVDSEADSLNTWPGGEKIDFELKVEGRGGAV